MLTTVGSTEKAKACVRLGADLAIVYSEEDFVVATLAATGGKGADVILDMVGGDYVARNYAAAAVDGRIVQIAFLHGRKVEIDLQPIMAKRLDAHTGSTLRPRSVAEKAQIMNSLKARRLAAARQRPLPAADQLDLPARSSRRRPPPHRQRKPCRQDRADALTLCRATS